MYFALAMRDTAREERAWAAATSALPSSQREVWDTGGANLQARGEREQALTWVCGGLAVATATTGVWLLLRAPRAAEPPAWSLGVDPHAARATYSTRF